MKKFISFMLVVAMSFSFALCFSAETKGSKPEVASLFGDVNADGKVSDPDAVRLLRYISNWVVKLDLTAADVDRDGKVSDRDAVILLRYIANWKLEFIS